MSWLTLLAILLSPFLAVFAQSKIEARTLRRGQKIWIYKTLMGTRATPLDFNHVQALNMVIIEFSEKNKKEKEVIDAWKVLMDNFSDEVKKPDTQEEGAAYEAKMAVWNTDNQDNLVDLLDKMGKSLGYDYDKVQLKRGVYYPKGHGDDEMEQRILRRSLLNLTLGQAPLKISISDREEE